jgi:hypothetical protein
MSGTPLQSYKTVLGADCPSTSVSAKDLGKKMMAPPGPHGPLPQSHSARSVFFVLSSRDRAPHCAPVCPFSPRKRTFAGCGVANGTTAEHLSGMTGYW